MKKIEKIIICLLLVLTLFGCQKEETQEEPVTGDTDIMLISKVIEVKEIKKHGNVSLNTDIKSFEEGFEAGDLVDVIVNDVSYTMPVAKSFSDVDSGQMICRIDDEDDEVMLAINMGNFAETTGIDENTKSVTVQINQKAGYLNEYNIRNLERSYEREDYSELSDNEYANARNIAVGDIKEGVLYRSSSPVDNDLNRASYADAYIKEMGVKTIVNLDDDEDELKEYEGYSDTYYSTCNILLVNLDYSVTSNEYKKAIGDAVKFIISNDGPYLIHCKEGKNRVGIVSALFELFMNATLDEAKDDYIKSYENYHKITKDDEIYDIILDTTFTKTLEEMFNVDSLDNINLNEAAAIYLLDCGLSDIDLSEFKTILSK